MKNGRRNLGRMVVWLTTALVVGIWVGVLAGVNWDNGQIPCNPYYSCESDGWCGYHYGAQLPTNDSYSCIDEPSRRAVQ